ncbi:NAD(P)/FAD-dependent oxidoreductase [Oceanobacillus sp. 1P07AA]|uniref:NAD(P)/FAD-dependent oxidoreductase n=1 Tax=Oceanobacillus sp. 1P07AA TaxID=3132293 RepID=UPI0039A58C54
MFDSIVIGGGPAGLSAALVLGRARKRVVVFDDDNPRNKVTHESHGFLTRDGIHPSELKELGKRDILKYPTVSVEIQRVSEIHREKNHFQLMTEQGKLYQTKKVLLATGLKDVFPNVKGLDKFYGSSLFSCPFCDGWEMRDQALVVISENQEAAFNMGKKLSNWSKDIVVCTNGNRVLTEIQKRSFAKNGIQILEEKIDELIGENGQLQKIRFISGDEIHREGGLVTVGLKQASPFAESLGCVISDNGGIKTDGFGRTNIPGIYASGDTTISTPSQLIMAAAEGNKVGAMIVSDLIDESFKL